MELKNITAVEMSTILSQSKSMREVILTFGLSPNGSGGYRNIKNKIISLGLDIPKYNYYGGGNAQRFPAARVFCQNSSYSRQRLKARIINEKLIEYKCSWCGNSGEWCGKKLSLHIDHINGVNDDDRLENLRFLCPNCHSQTETYAGKKNIKSTI